MVPTCLHPEIPGPATLSPTRRSRNQNAGRRPSRKLAGGAVRNERNPRMTSKKISDEPRRGDRRVRLSNNVANLFVVCSEGATPEKQRILRRCGRPFSVWSPPSHPAPDHGPFFPSPFPAHAASLTRRRQALEPYCQNCISHLPKSG
jgi:hypothetical protein